MSVAGVGGTAVARTLVTWVRGPWTSGEDGWSYRIRGARADFAQLVDEPPPRLVVGAVRPEEALVAAG